MSRRFAIPGVLFALITTALVAQELPNHDGDESFEIEPPILIPNRDRDRQRETGSISATSATPAPVNLQQLERDFERAKRSAGGAEHLFKIGVLAKVEVEQRTLRMVRLQSEVENLRLQLAKEEFAILEKGLTAGEVSREDFKEAEIALARAISAAHTAAANRERAELEAAEANLRRQRQLVSLGIGRKSEVARAEQKLAELKAQKN